MNKEKKTQLGLLRSVARIVRQRARASNLEEAKENESGSSKPPIVWTAGLRADLTLDEDERERWAAALALVFWLIGWPCFVFLSFFGPCFVFLIRSFQEQQSQFSHPSIIQRLGGRAQCG
jgi:hypothetical protein